MCLYQHYNNTLLYLICYLDMRFNIVGDTNSIEKRVFFENGKDKISMEIVAHISTQSCTELKAYIRVWYEIEHIN